LHIAHQAEACLAGSIGFAVDAYIHHHCAWLHVLGPNHFGAASSNYQNIRLASKET
jgi:hypothetical protein